MSKRIFKNKRLMRSLLILAGFLIVGFFLWTMLFKNTKIFEGQQGKPSELDIVTKLVDEIVDECREETKGASPGFDSCITNALVSNGITNFTLSDTNTAISKKLENKESTTLKGNIISRVMERRQEHIDTARRQQHIDTARQQ